MFWIFLEPSWHGFWFGLSVFVFLGYVSFCWILLWCSQSLEICSNNSAFPPNQPGAAEGRGWGRETITRWPGHRVGARPAGPSGKTRMPHHGPLPPISLLS